MPSYSGIWTLSQQFQAVGQGLWPPNYVLDGTFGIFALGFVTCTFSTTRNKYTYSGCAVSAGAAATVASIGGSAVGDSTVGIFALGNSNPGGASTTRTKYTSSGC